MDRASKHCMCARISICQDQIKSANKIIDNTKWELSSLIDDAALSSLIQFLQKKSLFCTEQHQSKTRQEAK